MLHHSRRKPSLLVHITSKRMNVADQIIEYLRRNPLKKGREIAAALGITKHEANSTLYRLEGSQFRHDDQFRWDVITTPVRSTSTFPDSKLVLDDSQVATFHARRELSRLKRGVPPTWSVAQLAVGMDHLVSRLAGLLPPGASPRWFGVTGEYGEGKSFFRSLACETALRMEYAVATLDVNKDEGALNHPQRHYSSIVNSLRSPDRMLTHGFGLADLFQTWIERSSPAEIEKTIQLLRSVEPILPPGQSQANFYWITSRLGDMLSGSQRDSWGDGPASQWCRSAVIPFLAGNDLIKKGTYARFSGAYRLQLLLKWLEATGHKGLLLVIDELDNVVRQIAGKGHPACFRTLAWYCSNPGLRNLRVIFASTPEVVDVIDAQGRAWFSQALSHQQTVLREEFKTFERWRREADQLGSELWSHCPQLTRAQRLTLFGRIAGIHKVAWGSDHASSSAIADSMSRMPQFTTTRRWVRASTQLLDIFDQHRELQNGHDPRGLPVAMRT